MFSDRGIMNNISDKDNEKRLHELFHALKDAALSKKTKIGFHLFRNQQILLDMLSTVGIKKRFWQNTRDFIREQIITKPQVYDVLCSKICIQMNHKGEVWFWDGYGHKKSGQHYHESEIIFDLSSDIYVMFSGVLEGLKENDNSEKRIASTQNNKISYKTIANHIYKEIICKEDYFVRIKIAVNENLLHDDMEVIDNINIEQEYFLLSMFLTAFCFQRGFSHYGNEKVKRILDEIHNLIEPRMDEETKVLLPERYKQYYQAMRDDQNDTVKGISKILFYSLSLAFVENLAGRKIDTLKEFLRTRIMLGITIAEILKVRYDVFARMSEQLKDCEIDFNN